MIASCLAAYRIVHLGAHAMASGLYKVIHRTDRFDLSLFRLGLKLLDHCLNEGLSIPVAFTPARAG